LFISIWALALVCQRSWKGTGLAYRKFSVDFREGIAGNAARNRELGIGLRGQDSGGTLNWLGCWSCEGADSEVEEDGDGS
jgi:hypothetical protein